MKSLTFDEFFAMPPGTIFGQVTGFPDQISHGIFIKRDSSSGDYVAGPSVSYVDILKCGSPTEEDFPLGLDFYDDHDRKFFVYEPCDLDRLAVLIGHGADTQVLSAIRSIEVEGGFVDWVDPATIRPCEHHGCPRPSTRYVMGASGVFCDEHSPSMEATRPHGWNSWPWTWTKRLPALIGRGPGWVAQGEGDA